MAKRKPKQSQPADTVHYPSPGEVELVSADLIEANDVARNTALQAILSGTNANRQVMAQAARSKELTREEWQRLTKAIAVQAAMDGEYGPALKGMELLGKNVGALNDSPSQHLHVYDNPVIVKELPTAELEARLAQLKLEAKKPLQPPQSTDKEDAPTT